MRWGRQTTYVPVIRVTTPAGLTVASRTRAATGGATFRVGQTVRVFYDPDDPKDLRIDDFWARWTLAIFAALAAAVLFAVAGVSFVAQLSR